MNPDTGPVNLCLCGACLPDDIPLSLLLCFSAFLSISVSPLSSLLLYPLSLFPSLALCFFEPLLFPLLYISSVSLAFSISSSNLIHVSLLHTLHMTGSACQGVTIFLYLCSK